MIANIEVFRSALKWVLGVFRAIPQLALLIVLIGGFWLWDELTPKRDPPPGPKPYQSSAPAPAPSRSSISDCRTIPFDYKRTDGARHAGVLYSYLSDGQRHYSKTEPDGCTYVSSQTDDAGASSAPQYTKPVLAPNGSPWPKSAAYVKGYPIDADSGYSEVTVDNSQNDADVFVKLVSLDGAAAFPVRQFYMPAGSRFTVEKVSAGKYDIRYRDLGTGGLSRSEAFDVEETRIPDGVQYSTITMTLYKVAEGNFQTYDLADSEF